MVYKKGEHSSPKTEFKKGFIPWNKGLLLPNKKVSTNCLTCGKEFLVNKSEISRGHGKHCSHRCYSLDRKKIIVHRNCKFCGVDFTPSISEVRQGYGIFCSISCRIKGLVGCSKKKRTTPVWNKGKKMSPEHCLILSKAHIGLKGNQTGKTHSLESKIKMSLSNRKNKVDKWDGFIKNKDTLEREKFRRIMQKSVLERDDYTCQMCGVRGGQLQVDHIQKWSDNKELRFEIDNCRTLCMGCHYFVTFGKKKPKEVIWGHNLSHRRSTYLY